MAEGGVTERRRYVNKYGLAFYELREEEMQEGQAMKTHHKDKTNALCDNCFGNSLNVITKIVAFYLCFVCEKYFCDKCFEGHESHKYVKLVSKESEKDEQINSFLDEMMNESEREDKMERENVSMVDMVNVEHRLDREDHCRISGLCGLGNTRWVVADSGNYCIKIFNVGSNLIQRYIRLGTPPFDITDVKVKSKSSEQVANTTGDLSVTSHSEPLLLAITIPPYNLIQIIDVTHSPAVITKTIKIEKSCHSIHSRGGNLVTLCCDGLSIGDRRWFICVMTTDGTIIQTINLDLHRRHLLPHLDVSSERFYITDSGNHRLLCLDNEGNEVYHKTIEQSIPVGISVDPDTEQVYVCSWYHDKVYRLNSSLKCSEILFDFESVNLKFPEVLCLHRDRLYVSHGPMSTHNNFVSVVRVL